MGRALNYGLFTVLVLALASGVSAYNVVSSVMFSNDSYSTMDPAACMPVNVTMDAPITASFMNCEVYTDAGATQWASVAFPLNNEDSKVINICGGGNNTVSGKLTFSPGLNQIKVSCYNAGNLSNIVQAYANLTFTNAFIATWDTQSTSPGSSNSDQITLPLESDGTYDFTVDWGDGNSDYITGYADPAVTHTYASPGTYTTKINGTIVGFNFGYGNTDKYKILNVERWGPLNPGVGSSFYGVPVNGHGQNFMDCQNLTSNATDPMNLTGVQNLYNFFQGAKKFNGNISNWDTSNIVVTAQMFGNANAFNQSLNNWNTSSLMYAEMMFVDAWAYDQPMNNWDTSNVVNMKQMFGASGSSHTSFNHDISSWNTQNVTDMSYMFYQNSKFNQNIGSWDTSKVTDMTSMFYGATAFNQPIGTWNTSSVTNMQYMFARATSFNQPLNSWDVSHVTTMESMFEGWYDINMTFNQPLNNWDTHNVTTMRSMFWANIAFNSNISTWNTSKVTNMEDMFDYALAFDQPIGSWDVSSVTDMTRMFWGGKFNHSLNTWNTSSLTNMFAMFLQNRYYNQPMNNWDVSHVTDMTGVFDGTQFNQDISGWNTSSVTTMNQLFADDNVFNQPIGSWDTSKVTDMSLMFKNDLAFNQSIGLWDVRNVTNMYAMFWQETTSSFNQPLNSWNTSSLQDTRFMFYGSIYNQPLNNWDVSHVQTMFGMFEGSSFNQPLNLWNTSSVTSMAIMFGNNHVFNQDISMWDTSNVWNFNSMFAGAWAFNQNISTWNTSSVVAAGAANMFSSAFAFNQSLNNWDMSHATNLNQMFMYATNFSSDISAWNTSSVTSMDSMFYGATKFNSNISSWDVSNVNNMDSMFTTASSFNQDISGWKVNKVTDMFQLFASTTFNQNLSAWDIRNVTNAGGMFANSNLSVLNYDSILMAWAAEGPKTGVAFGAQTRQYGAEAISARNTLTTTYSWTISDDGQVPTSYANFTFSPSSGVYPLTVFFTDHSNATPISWYWEFGDGNTSTLQNVSHTYVAPGSYIVNLTVWTIGGATSLQQNAVTVSGFVANFTGTPVNGTVPLTVQFNDTSNANATSWLWDFGDGNTSTNKSPSHVYTIVGNYTVNMTVVYNGTSYSQVKTNYVKVNQIPAPTANFVANQTVGLYPLTVSFTDTSTGSPTSWYWNLGDGTNSTLQNPQHTYSSSGVYDVGLAATNDGGTNITIKIGYITANPYVANFTGTPLNGTTPVTVQFTDTSSTIASSYAWDFENDGIVDSTNRSPSHVYGVAGNYTVNMTVVYNGTTYSQVKTNYVTVNPVTPPSANFTGTPLTGYPRVVTFTDSSLYSPTSWSWDFGDGGTSTSQNPAHNYTTPGTYTVNLTATNLGGSNTMSKVAYVTVSAIPAPVANFTGTPLTGYVRTVTFTDLSTYVAPYTISSWAWTFGDGGTSSSANTTHTYSTPGTYNVNLTVTNVGGSDTMSKTAYVVVNANETPVATFSTAATGYANVSHSFTDTTTVGPAASWYWQFGDGGTSTLQNPTHTYVTIGNFTANLTVTNNVGSSSVTHNVEVLATPPPQSVYNFSDNIIFWSDLSEGSGLPVDLTGHVTNISMANATWNSTSKPSAFNYSITTAGSAVGNDQMGLFLRSSMFDNFWNGSEARGMCTWVNPMGDTSNDVGVAQYRTQNGSPYGPENYGLMNNQIWLITTKMATFNSSYKTPMHQNKSTLIQGAPTIGLTDASWHQFCVITEDKEGLLRTYESFGGEKAMFTTMFWDGVQINQGTMRSALQVDDVAGGSFIFGSATYGGAGPISTTQKVSFAQPIVFKFSKEIPVAPMLSCLYNGGAGRTYSSFLANCNATVLVEPTLNYTGSALQANYKLWSATGTGNDNSTFRWFVNGSLVGGQTTNTLSTAFWGQNDVVTVEITPNDGVSSGVPMNISYPFSADFGYPLNGATLNGLQTISLTNVNFPDPYNTRVTYYLDGFFYPTFNFEMMGVKEYPVYNLTSDFTKVGRTFDTSAYVQGQHRIGVGVVNIKTGEKFRKEITVYFNNTNNRTSSIGTGSSVYPSGWSTPRLNVSTFGRGPGFGPMGVNSNASLLSAFLSNGTGTDPLLSIGNAQFNYVPFQWSDGTLQDYGSGKNPVTAAADIKNLTGAQCIYGDCIGFIGTANSKITMASPITTLATTTNTGLIMIWFYPNSTTTEQTIFGTVSTGAWQLKLGGANNLTPMFKVTAADTFATANASATLNAWNHIAVWHNSTLKKVWLNGQEVLSAAAPSASAVNLIIGQNGVNTSGVFNGRMDQFARYGFTIVSLPLASRNCNGVVGSNCTLNFALMANYLYNNGTGKFAENGFEYSDDGVLHVNDLGAYVFAKNIVVTSATPTTSGPKMVPVWYGYAYDKNNKLTILGTQSSGPLATALFQNRFSNATYTATAAGQSNPTTFPTDTSPAEITQYILTPFWNVSSDGPAPGAFTPGMKFAAIPKLCEQLANGTTYCVNNADVGGNYIFNATVQGTLAFAPVADFFANVTSGNAPLSVQFTDNSTDVPTSWYWNFGDGTNSTLQNATHVYSSAGNYSVSLTATNGVGSDTMTKTSYVNVNMQILPSINNTEFYRTFDQSLVIYETYDVGFRYNTSNFAGPDQSSYQWFVNGVLQVGETSKNLSATKFNANDQLTIQVTPYDGTQYGTPVNESVVVQTIPDPSVYVYWTDGMEFNQTNISLTFDAGYAKTCTFYDNGNQFYDSYTNYTSLPYGQPRTYVDYTGGTIMPSTFGLTGYDLPLNYDGQIHNISMTCYNVDNSKSASGGAMVRIGNIVAPVANFTANTTSGYGTLDVQFTDLSSNNPTSWYWNFGDGTNSTLQNPTHTYTVAGVYSVGLAATNDAGTNITVKTNYITVHALAVANFTSNVTTGYEPLPVQFLDQSQNNITSWSWSFGDGGTSNNQSPAHTYALPGNYTVQLNVTNAGSSDSKTVVNYIQITKRPYVSIGTGVCSAPTTIPNELDQPSANTLQVSFLVDSLPIGNLTSAIWDGKSGSCSYTSVNSTGRNYTCNYTVNYYDAPGTFNVSVVYANTPEATVQTANVASCAIGGLLAYQKVIPTIAFPTAAPGINNAPGSAPVTVQNTGNVPVHLYMTGYDLNGRTISANKLESVNFKTGATLGSSYTLPNGVMRNTGVVVGVNASSNDYLWLSMPANQFPQDYYSATPWEITGLTS